MAIRNEAAFIGRSLGAALAQDYRPNRMELIVVDGMSNDGTPKIVEEIMRQHADRNIRLIHNPRRIFSTGFNIGVTQAQGEVIIMLGGHTEISPKYIRCCIECLENNPEIDCVGGYIDTVTESAEGRAIAVAMSSQFGVGGVSFRMRPNYQIEVDTVAFGAYRRSVIKRCGLLDEDLIHNQDDEYNYRLREIGGRILLIPNIASRYYSRQSLASLWEQYFRYGYWKVRVLQKHPRQMRPRHFIPPTFVATIMGSALLNLIMPFGGILLVSFSGIYLLANFAASFWTASRQGWRNLFLLPPIYAILHISYGLGFLVGMVRFANHWGDKCGNVPRI